MQYSQSPRVVVSRRHPKPKWRSEIVDLTRTPTDPVRNPILDANGVEVPVTTTVVQSCPKGA